MILDLLIGVLVGVAAMVLLGQNRHRTWSYVVVLIWLGLVALSTFLYGAWWRWAALAVWVWIVYDWRKPMKKKREPTPRDLVLALSDLYTEAALATVALAHHLEEREDPRFEELCELLTAMCDTIVSMNVHLVSAAKVATTEAPNTKEDER